MVELAFGASSGAPLIAAKRVRKQLPELKTVVTAFCDEGEKYLHEYFMRPDSAALGPTPFA